MNIVLSVFSKRSEIGYEVIISRVIGHSGLEGHFLGETSPQKPEKILRIVPKNVNNKQCCRYCKNKCVLKFK